MPGLSEFLFGKSDKTKSLNVLTPEQKRALSEYFSQGIDKNPLYSSGSSYLQGLLSNSPDAFSAFEAPYFQNFEQNIIPSIAERFAGMGTGAGASSSSALYNSLAQAGRSLQTDLAGLRSGLQMQALPQALGYAQQPYSNKLAGIGARGFENVYQPGSTGLLGGITSGLASGLGSGFGLAGAGSLFNSFGSSLLGRVG